MSTALEKLKARLYDVNALDCAAAMMDWDMQTYMPPGGGAARAAHLGILTRMSHEQFTSDEVGKWIEEARASVSGDSDDAALLRVVKREFDLKTKVPASLVAEKISLSAEAHEVWVQARQANDFGKFEPYLEKMFEFCRQEAEHLGYKNEIYDALLDQYEEGATAEDCRRMFGTVRDPLSSLVKEITEHGKRTDDHLLYGDWEVEKQKEFTEFLLNEIGFDMSRGRQDTAPHPFCTGWSVNDIRLTTRYKKYLPSAIFGTLHEAGHGMYEQGSPVKWDRTPLAGGVSLGIHESQSRTWENIVGRSRAFWKRFLHVLQSHFRAIDAFDVDTFYRAINRVQPSLIRVEADEVTYNLHIIVRFEIETEVLSGKMKVSDMPDAWNDKYRQYLGITPPNDSDGCMQDVHWSAGLVGYFPTYCMGNLLSYQFWSKLEQDLGNTDVLIEAGEFDKIRGWLTDKIYSKGKSVPPRDLVKQVTGKEMGAEDYLNALTSKYKEIYAL